MSFFIKLKYEYCFFHKNLLYMNVIISPQNPLLVVKGDDYTGADGQIRTGKSRGPVSDGHDTDPFRVKGSVYYSPKSCSPKPAMMTMKYS